LRELHPFPTRRSSDLDQFYTDPTIRKWYKDWIAHLLNRTNTYTGLQYKDDATILGWELANEPRCGAGGAYPTSGNCTTHTLNNRSEEHTSELQSHLNL